MPTHEPTGWRRSDPRVWEADLGRA